MKKLCIISALLYTTMSHSQVNLQTGAAELNFPLFQYSDPQSRLGTGISLSYYNGNGLKANEIASSVGTGWALQMGGVISRKQNGEPDDQLYVNVYPELGGETFYEQIVLGLFQDYYFPDGYMYTLKQPSDPVSDRVAYVPVFGTNVSATDYKANFSDREQDIYSFQFNGISGQFVIGKDKKPVLVNDSKIKISFIEEDLTSQLVRTRISSFIIIDENGIKYKFSEKELSTIFKYKGAEARNGYSIIRGKDLAGYPYPAALNKIVSKWFVSEIENPATGEKIVFNYETYQLEVDGEKKISYQSTIIDGVNHSSKAVLVEKSKIIGKRVISIDCPDLHRIVFDYDAIPRVDLPGDLALRTIRVYFENKLYQSFQFGYSYLYKKELKPYDFTFGVAEKRFARLCLTSLSKVASDGKVLPGNLFTYNLPDPQTTFITDIVPPSFSILTDHWGYYNHDSKTMVEDADGYPSNSYFIEKDFWTYPPDGKNGIIKSVQYPEGGKLEFEYEINQAEGSIYQNKYAGGVRVSKTTLYDGNSHANDIIRQYKYLNENGTSSGWGFEAPIYTETRNAHNSVSSASYTKVGSSVKEIVISQSISFFAKAAAGLSMRTVNPAATSGARNYQMNVGAVAPEAAMNKAINDFIIQAAIALFFAFQQPNTESSTQVINSFNKKLINPLPLQYKRVEVIDAIHNNGTINGSNGKTVYEFTSDQFLPLRVPTFSAPYSRKQRMAYWAYGLPQIITWYNGQNQKVRKVEHFYDLTKLSRENNANNVKSKSWVINRSVLLQVDKVNDNSIPGVPGVDNHTTSELYGLLQGRVELIRTVETLYNAVGASTTTETSYDYDPINFHLRKTIFKNSIGNFTGTTTYFPDDYNIPSSILDIMKTKNMIIEPVTVVNWIKNAQTNITKMIGSTVIEYAQISNGDIQPYKIYQSELITPLENTIAEVSLFNNARYVDYDYLKPIKVLSYNGGNLVQSTSIQESFSVSTLYDYNQRLAVAEVDNATSGEVKYTSFEADGVGGWSFNNTFIIEDYSPTGKKCFDLSKGNIQSTVAGLNKPIILSMWATVLPSITSSGSVNFASPKIGGAINGWTYYEFESSGNITQSVEITVAGSGKLDELRLYPKNARMATATYDPGIGKTSECDANNRIIYYEYDAFGRLIQVRDQYRNLIKAIEYNFKQ